jgi:dUTP pyrophosphatase
LGKEAFPIQPHDRIAQMVLAKVEKAGFSFEDDLSQTLRGEGGFGSTGVKKDH